MNIDLHLEPQTTIRTIYKWLFGVPGTSSRKKIGWFGCFCEAAPFSDQKCKFGFLIFGNVLFSEPFRSTKFMKKTLRTLM